MKRLAVPGVAESGESHRPGNSGDWPCKTHRSPTTASSTAVPSGVARNSLSPSAGEKPSSAAVNTASSPGAIDPAGSTYSSPAEDRMTYPAGLTAASPALVSSIQNPPPPAATSLKTSPSPAAGISVGATSAVSSAPMTMSVLSAACWWTSTARRFVPGCKSPTGIVM